MTHTIFTILTILLLARIAYIDHKSRIIPNRYNLALLALAILWSICEPRAMEYSSRIAGLLLIPVPFLLLNLCCPGGIGGGDIKLLAAAGYLLGWKRALYATFYGSLLAAATFATLLFLHKTTRTSTQPFGPYLALAITLALP